MLEALRVHTTELSRIHDELDCLLDARDTAGTEAISRTMKHIAVLLVAASNTQAT